MSRNALPLASWPKPIAHADVGAADVEIEVGLERPAAVFVHLDPGGPLGDEHIDAHADVHLGADEVDGHLDRSEIDHDGSVLVVGHDAPDGPHLVRRNRDRVDDVAVGIDHVRIVSTRRLIRRVGRRHVGAIHLADVDAESAATRWLRVVDLTGLRVDDQRVVAVLLATGDHVHHDGRTEIVHVAGQHRQIDDDHVEVQILDQAHVVAVLVDQHLVAAGHLVHRMGLAVVRHVADVLRAFAGRVGDTDDVVVVVDEHHGPVRQDPLVDGLTVVGGLAPVERVARGVRLGHRRFLCGELGRFLGPSLGGGLVAGNRIVGPVLEVVALVGTQHLPRRVEFVIDLGGAQVADVRGVGIVGSAPDAAAGGLTEVGTGVDRGFQATVAGDSAAMGIHRHVTLPSLRRPCPGRWRRHAVPR